MRFNISSYVSELESELITMDARRRIFFSAWCTDEVLRHSLKSVPNIAINHLLGLQEKVSDECWGFALGTVKSSESSLYELKNRVTSTEWAKAADFDLETTEGILTVQILSCFETILEARRTGEAAKAAAVAEHVINVIDFQLGNEFGESSTDRVFSDTRMVNAINRQRAMITFLKS